MRVFLEHHKLARLTYRESMSLDPELERLLRDFYRDLARVEADNIRVGIELGIFRSVDPMICAYAHIGMVERVALALLHEPSPPEPRVVVRELLVDRVRGTEEAMMATRKEPKPIGAEQSALAALQQVLDEERVAHIKTREQLARENEALRVRIAELEGELTRAAANARELEARLQARSR